MIEDKDIGELWAYYNHDDRESKDMRTVIRKLVEERAKYLTLLYRKSPKSAQDFALGDFGIDPADYHD